MTFDKAHNLLLQGLPIRRKTWLPDANLCNERGSVGSITLADMKQDDWEIYSPPTKSVYQWRYRESKTGLYWKLAKSLMTEAEAATYFSADDYCVHSGPFEVPY